MSSPLHRIWLLIAGLTVLAIVVTALIIAPVVQTDRLWVAVLVALGFAAAERSVLSIRLGHQTQSMSLSEVPLIAGLFLLSPTMLVIARMVGVLQGLKGFRHQDTHKLAFNAVYMWLETLLAIQILRLVNPTDITDGFAGGLTALLVAVSVTLSAALAITLAISVHEGRSRHQLIVGGIRQGLGPAIATAAFTVVALVIGRLTPELLWAPAIAIGVLFLSYRSHVRLVSSEDLHTRILEFTRQTTGADGVRETAEQIIRAAKNILQAPAVAIHCHHSDGTSGWINPDGIPVSVLASISDGPAESRSGTWRQKVGTSSLVCQSLDSVPDGVLAVEATAEMADRADHLRAVAMIAAHASVALASANRAAALELQARTAEHLAQHDSLTGLHNRPALLGAMAWAVDAGQPFAVLLADLDDFKEINDALGHASGDQVLVEVSRRLQPWNPGMMMLARLGGDEFAVLVTGQAPEAMVTASEMLERIRRPVAVGPYSLQIDCSVGISLFPAHGDNGDTLLKHADLAMYDAKAGNKGMAVFGSSDAGRAVRHLAVSSSFRSALQDGVITAHYQPQVDLATGRIFGVEALARWTDPSLGVVGPDEFIKVAEQSGLLPELTNRMINDALKWQQQWQAQGLDLIVAVNLSARSLLDYELPGRIAASLASFGVTPDRLTIEITESSVIIDPQRTKAILTRLGALGIRLSIDDFGTGYSSLAYLQELPVDEVKIDKSFVLPMAEDSKAVPLVEGITRLCHELGFSVLAEGIESGDVQRTLRRLGCDAGQGYHIARPMPPEDLIGWATAQPAAVASAV